MILKNYQVLAIKDVDSIIVSKHHQLFEYSISKNTFKLLFKFEWNFKTGLSQISKPLRRLLRTDIRYGFKLSEDEILLAYKNKFYKLQLSTKKILSEIAIPRGSRPLNMIQLNNFKEFDDGVYFGEYFTNPDKKPVHIYKYIDGHIKSITTFEQNTINHIHNLIPDRFRDCVWILAGDFDDSAAIYKATENFNKIEKIVSGHQEYRSCVAFPVEQGLLYATDSQFEQNSIRLLKEDTNKKWISEPLHYINGSCIFGALINNEYYFSTAVEAVNSGNKFQILLRNRRGPGILKNVVEIVKMDNSNILTTIYSNKKDCLPFVPFQFGNILFPTGLNESNLLIFTPIATKKNDFSTIIKPV